MAAWQGRSSLFHSCYRGYRLILTKLQVTWLNSVDWRPSETFEIVRELEYIETATKVTATLPLHELEGNILLPDGQTNTKYYGFRKLLEKNLYR